MNPALAGSSPLTRGKRAASATQNRVQGLIPAHAGKTSSPAARQRTYPAHPRSRGENAFSRAEGPGCLGSSPLTRGKRVPGGPQLGADRLIPAHAGKTMRRAGTCVDPRAHPRSRGENPDSYKPGVSVPGSSPLTRGKRVCDEVAPDDCRLIPAHAGKTARRRSAAGGRWAHPRSRGENINTWGGANTMSGSSPLTRGKRRAGRRTRPSRGLIPAHAGKTDRAFRSTSDHTAHPRSRGENAQAARITPIVAGSSPLTRGKHYCCADRRAHARLIPAHAGKTGSPA